MFAGSQRPREPNIQREDLLISSPSGTELRATISRAKEPKGSTAAILCPGFAVGKEGQFVRSMETALFNEEVIALGARFNFSGHENDNFNTDLQGFTFEKAVKDFKAVVQYLKGEGAQRIVAFGSSTGVQPAILASCEDGPRADLILGRSSVLDCFQSVMASVPEDVRIEWKNAGSFEFPVGDQMVRLSAQLLDDIASWDLPSIMGRLDTPVRLIHGDQDEVVPLEIVQRSLSFAPRETINLQVLPSRGHELSNDFNSFEFRWMIEQAK